MAERRSPCHIRSIALDLSVIDSVLHRTLQSSQPLGGGGRPGRPKARRHFFPARVQAAFPGLNRTRAVSIL